MSRLRYLQEYEKHWDIDPWRPLPLQVYQDRTLYTTWDLSYARLQREDAEAATLLGVLAYFSNRRIWYELFRAGFSDDSPPWLHGVISSDRAFQSTMRKLTDYCFVEVQTSVASWSMHTCVHDWTFAALNLVVDEKQYWYAFDCVGTSVEQEDFDSLGHFPLTNLTAHAIRLGQVSDHRGDVMKSLNNNRLGKAYLIAELLTQQVQHIAAEQMYMLTLAGYEKALGADHTSTLDTVNNLGLLYTNQGKLDEAERMYQRALAGYEKALGPDHTSTLCTVSNLGLLYANQGKLDEAERMYQRALGGYEKALGADHTSTLNTVDNLGDLYADQDKLDGAERMYRRALQGFQKSLGAEHPSIVTVRANLKDLQARFDRATRLDSTQNVELSTMTDNKKWWKFKKRK
ncbi:hypothetical protein LTR47_011769 [Exophiala xenobiotica]|nr:hypothetical protein LTR47_011769 [Exophiala xenobiotica]